MLLFIACLLIFGHGLHPALYAVAAVIWVAEMVFSKRPDWRHREALTYNDFPRSQ